MEKSSKSRLGTRWSEDVVSYLSPATVRGSPSDGVSRSKCEAETPYNIEIAMICGTNAYLES